MYMPTLNKLIIIKIMIIIRLIERNDNAVQK